MQQPYIVNVNVTFGHQPEQPRIKTLKEILSPQYFWPKDGARIPIDPSKFGPDGKRLPGDH